MKKSKKLTPIVTKINDKFMDLSIPQFDWIDSKLEWVNTVMKNSDDEIVEESNQFVVTFNMSKKMKAEDKSLSEEFKNITGMNFAPYYWQEKEYRFYTSKYNSIDDNQRKELLISLFDLMKNFEIKINQNLELSADAFKEDLNIKKSYDTELLSMKFCDEKNTFIVIAKGYIGKEAFRKLISSSSKTFKLGVDSTENELPEGFFNDLNIPNLKNKMVFVLNQDGYLSVKDLFESEKIKADNFIKEQEKLIEDGLNIYDIEYTDENIFDFKIKFNQSKKCFEFYAKGYNSTYYQMIYEESLNSNYSSYGRYPQVIPKYTPSKKSILSMLSVNYICSEPNPDITEEGMKVTLDKQSMMYNKNFVKLNIMKGSDAKAKVLYVPLSDYDSLKEMRNRFLKLNEIFSLPDVKITCKTANIPNFEDIPVILFNKKLNPFLVYSMKQTGQFIPKPSTLAGNVWDLIDEQEEAEGKEVKKIKPYQATMIGKEISYQQAMHFLNEHELSDEIKRVSIKVNAYFHVGNELEVLNSEEQSEVFDKVLLMAKIHAENPEKNIKRKSNKI